MFGPIDSAPCREKEASAAQGHGGGTTDVERAKHLPKEPQDEESSGHPSDNPEHAAREKWNESRTNIFRFSVALFGFIIMGMNDAVLGVSYDTGGL